MKLADVSIRRPVFALMMSVAMVTLGVFSYGSLGVDLMPRTDQPTVNVRVGLPGASAEEVESTISLPIETAVNSIDARDKLVELRKEVELLLYEDEGHSFLKIENVIDSEMKRVDFLVRMLDK